jgi:hypothetical protein
MMGFILDPPPIVRIFLAGLITGAGGGIFYGWSTYGGPLVASFVGAALLIGGGFWLVTEIREMRAELRRW